MPAIALNKVTKRFGRIVALKEVTLEVPEGALFGLIGPNGAGKTTTFGLLSGFLRATEGTVEVRGVTLSPGRPPLGKILALPQDASIPPRTRVQPVLTMLGRFAGLSKAEAIERGLRALEKVGLSEQAEQRVGTLSHGQRRRVGIAQTLMGDNEVILLDEPTAGLDPRTAGELRELIKELREDRTMILSSHNLAEVEALCSHAAILDHGVLVANGPMDEIKSTGTLVHVSLAKPLEQPDDVVAGLVELKGVVTADVSSDCTMINLELEETGDAVDEVTNLVLKLLIEKNATVKSVDRGKSLEQRFMEETSKNE